MRSIFFLSTRVFICVSVLQCVFVVQFVCVCVCTVHLPEVHVSMQSQSQDVGDGSSRAAATNQNDHRGDVSQLEALKHITMTQTGDRVHHGSCSDVSDGSGV